MLEKTDVDWNSLFKQSDKFFEANTLLKVFLFDKFGEKLGFLYSIIDDLDKFCQILDVLGGKSICFPTVEEFKFAINLVLVYYYKDLKHYDWNKIEELMSYENDISLKYGSKIKLIRDALKKNINKKESFEKNIFELQ